jgi:hypothetical protein
MRLCSIIAIGTECPCRVFPPPHRRSIHFLFVVSPILRVVSHHHLLVVVVSRPLSLHPRLGPPPHLSRPSSSSPILALLLRVSPLLRAVSPFTMWFPPPPPRLSSSFPPFSVSSHAFSTSFHPPSPRRSPSSASSSCSSSHRCVALVVVVVLLMLAWRLRVVRSS